MRTLRPMTRRAAGVATLLSAALTLMLGLTGAADANPATGMIDGSYAARMPAYYLQKTRRAGVNRVCVQIASSGADLTGTVKTQAHGGTWTDTGHVVTLVPDSVATVPPLKPASEYETDAAWNTAREAWETHHRNEDGSVKPRGGRENCGFYAMDASNRPVNWCGMRRSITPAHGWSGHLTSDAMALRVQARDHILNMPGPVGLAYNSTCP